MDRKLRRTGRRTARVDVPGVCECRAEQRCGRPCYQLAARPRMTGGMTACMQHSKLLEHPGSRRTNPGVRCERLDVGESRGTILVVEDDAALRQTLRDALRGEDYRVIEAANAEHGAQLAKCERPSLVLLDLTLVGPSGIDML